MTEFIVTTILLALVLMAAVATLIVLLTRTKKKESGASADTPLSEEYFADTLHEVEKGIKANMDAQERVIKENISSTSNAQTNAISAYMKSITDNTEKTHLAVSENFEKLAQKVDERLQTLGKQTEERLDKLDDNVQKSLDKVREDNSIQLDKVRRDNSDQLDKIRATVDEKLNETLNKRLNESFQTVQTSLENVYKGLGEMKSLGEQVSNMNKLLGGVKTRGNWGEVALEALLDDILAPEQYERQCQVRRGSGERVDFAVRMPGSEGKEVLLPIDSKFPTEDYLRYADAVNIGDNAAAEGYLKYFKDSVIRQGRSIRDKYIGASTTDFAVMYLPSESVYAEVVRDEELMGKLRRDCNVVPCGPSTMAALLNSLKMGFTTMKLQKSSKEIAKAFQDFKKQFEFFSGMVEKAQRQNETVGGTLGQIADRTGKVMKKINKITDENPEVGEEGGAVQLPGGDEE